VTERQAWQKLAEDVKGGKWPYTFGLCNGISALRAPHGVKDLMYQRIDRLKHRYDPYVWRRDEAGDKQRIAYCLRQVARLSAAKKAKR
jgi:hypothetical protein